MTGSIRTTHVRVEGRVQGVGYRLWTQRIAVELGLRGWVRNRRDGSVEAVFQGPETSVAEMIERCKTGPAGARVIDVRVLEDAMGAFTGFEVRETA